MKKRYLLIILILALILITNGCINNNSINGANAETVKCISEKSTIYVSATCTACAAQKKIFGSQFENLNSVDCAEEAQKCLEAGISRVPTWIINGEKIVGLKSIDELKELTGC